MEGNGMQRGIGMKSSTERSRVRREKLKVQSFLRGGDLVPPVSRGSPGGELGVDQLRAEVAELRALLRAVDTRLVSLEDGVVPEREPVAPRPIAELRAQIAAVPGVREAPVVGFRDPQTLTGQALRDWVRRNGPVPTSYGDLESS